MEIRVEGDEDAVRSFRPRGCCKVKVTLTLASGGEGF